MCKGIDYPETCCPELDYHPVFNKERQIESVQGMGQFRVILLLAKLPRV